jgi:flagellar biosynthesis protein FlhG
MDQAEGLRHILQRASRRVVAVKGARGGDGATTLVINLAHALASQGKHVLVIDEHLSHDNVGNRLCLRPRFDLLNIQGDGMTWQDVLLSPSPGFSVLPAAKASKQFQRLPPRERARLLDALARAMSHADIVLVDAPVAGPSLCTHLDCRESCLVVLNSTASGLTSAYGSIKQMFLNEGRRDYDIVITKTGKGAEPHIAFENLARVAQHHLKVRLALQGMVPYDDILEGHVPMSSAKKGALPSSTIAQAFLDLADNLFPGRSRGRNIEAPQFAGAVA